MVSLPPAQSMYGRKFQLLIYDTNGGPVYDSQKKSLKTTIKDGVIATGISNQDEKFAGIDVSDLRCTFFVQKVLSPIQISEITIYNLSPQTETNIIFNATNAVLSAGYVDGPYGQIFTGRIIQKIRGKDPDGVTFFLKLVCMDGDQQLQTNFCNMAMGEGQTEEQQAKLIARNANVPFEPKVDLNLSQDQQKAFRGKTIFGRPRDYFRSIALNNGAAFYADKGDINITLLNTSPPNVVPELNYKSGMIGIPHQTDQGMEVRSLINPQFTIDSWIHLNNKNIIKQQITISEDQATFAPLLDLDGLYHIIGMTITGDTRGNDWYMDLITLTQLGQAANPLTSIAQTAF